MNFILAYIIEFFGLGKREWHYSHDTPSQHILDFIERVVVPHTPGFPFIDPRQDPYMPRPLLTGGTLSPSGVDVSLAWTGARPRYE